MGILLLLQINDVVNTTLDFLIGTYISNAPFTIHIKSHHGGNVQTENLDCLLFNMDYIGVAYKNVKLKSLV